MKPGEIYTLKRHRNIRQQPSFKTTPENCLLRMDPDDLVLFIDEPKRFESLSTSSVAWALVLHQSGFLGYILPATDSLQKLN